MLTSEIRAAHHLAPLMFTTICLHRYLFIYATSAGCASQLGFPATCPRGPKDHLDSCRHLDSARGDIQEPGNDQPNPASKFEDRLHQTFTISLGDGCDSWVVMHLRKLGCWVMLYHLRISRAEHGNRQGRPCHSVRHPSLHSCCRCFYHCFRCSCCCSYWCCWSCCLFVRCLLIDDRFCVLSLSLLFFVVAAVIDVVVLCLLVFFLVFSSGDRKSVV